jgi:hypothetical protein
MGPDREDVAEAADRSVDRRVPLTQPGPENVPDRVDLMDGTVAFGQVEDSVITEDANSAWPAVDPPRPGSPSGRVPLRPEADRSTLPASTDVADERADSAVAKIRAEPTEVIKSRCAERP